MRKLIFTLMVLIASITYASAQNMDSQITDIQQEVNAIKVKQALLNSATANNKKDVATIEGKMKRINTHLDSLEATLNTLNSTVNSVDAKLSSDIDETKKNVASTEVSLNSSIQNKAIIGLIALLILGCLGVAIYIVLRRKVSGNDDAIASIKNVQDKLQKAQNSLEEESIKLDNQLVEILEKQVNAAPAQSAPDHSLALKVADEITRMEVNLSRMDKSIKGYKQLTKAVERIKNNFSAKGYEITEMLGKPYVEGMKVIANFVPDETIPEGTQTITGIIKPQILFNGKLIQAAEITVSQNI